MERNFTPHYFRFFSRSFYSFPNKLDWIKFILFHKVLDNHVIDYVPPEVLLEKSVSLKKRTKEGLYGMAVVGALSSDPRLVNNFILTIVNFHLIYHF